MRVARFKGLLGRFDSAGKLQEATVTIDRGDRALFAVRVKRKRRQYELPLAFVAEMACHHVLRAEVAEKRKAKAAKRKAAGR